MVVSRLIAPTALLLALVGPLALAMVPPEGVAHGTDPSRVRTVDPAVQRVLGEQPVWRDFVATEAPTWEARFDQVTGTPHRMWGKGLDLGPLSSEDAVGKAVMAWVTEHPDLLGLHGADVRLASVAAVPTLDAWYADVDLFVGAVPVWRSGVTLRFKAGRLVMVGADTYPGAPTAGGWTLSPEQAQAAFATYGPAPWSEHTDATADRLWLPEVVGGRARLRAVWHVTSRTWEPMGRWEAFVDGDTGEVVAFFNTIRFFDGQLASERDARIGNGELTTSPLARAVVSNGIDEAVTDADGRFSIPDGESYTVSLRGPRLQIYDDLGNLTPAFTDANATLLADAWSNELAAPSAFTFVQQVQDFARGFAPEVRWVDQRVRTYVNIDDVCNAWFDGDINFLREGGGCRNTGRLADVVYHEWGHGFHADSIVSGDYDGSLGEGAADTMAFLLTDDPDIAPSFFIGAGRPLRTARNVFRWPTNYSTNEAFIHDNGRIFSGSMWDTREALRASLGEPEATQVASRLYAGLLKGGPSIETAYDEAVFADDDDGDLSNGTPHQCELVEGFGKHGLGPRGGFGVAPDHTAPEAVAGEALRLSWRVTSPAPTCLDLTPTVGTLHWRRNDEPWSTTPLTASGADMSVEVPGNELKLGDVITYWTEIETSEGTTLVEPTQGAIRPHTLYVGDVLEVYCNDFESGDGNFRHKLLSGDDVEGADDWMWGEPAGLSGDPATAFSGENVWGNDLGGGDYNGAYQDDRHNELRTPALKTRHYRGVVLRYMRWLGVEDGVFDQASVLADDTVVWSNHASSLDNGGEHHLDDAWASHVVDLAGQADDGSVVVAWDIVSDQGLGFGGWNIDDVCLYAPATADNRLGISDLVAADVDGGVSLSWTMPRHAPVTQVRVVRRRGNWPDGADDGEIVFETNDITVDAPASAVDDDPQSNMYYAVYASDGADWLSWTVEGWNAVAFDPAPGGPGTGPGAGCGCSSAGAGGAFGLWSVALVLVGLRRRRGDLFEPST